MSETYMLDDPRNGARVVGLRLPVLLRRAVQTAILVQHGLGISEMPLQAHPEIPLGGVRAGPRFSMVSQETF